VLQERLQAARQAVADLKKQNSALQERVHNLTHELEDAEVRKSELENQLKALQQVMVVGTWTGWLKWDRLSAVRACHVLVLARTMLNTQLTLWNVQTGPGVRKNQSHRNFREFLMSYT